jgi:hypothetical protein
MTELIRQERLERLERCLIHIESGLPFNGPTKDRIYKLVDLYIAHLRAEEPSWPYFDEGGAEQFNLKAAQNLICFIRLDPFIGRVKAAITALLNNDVQKALEILQSIVDEKDEIVSDIQRENRTGANKPSNYNDLLKTIYKKNPEITAKDMLKELKKEIGKGVIQRIDLNLDEIITKNGSSYSINGLKDYIYRFRKDEV